ncbi:mannose-6-phosphate receptor binding domain-containing protein [Tuber indicum]|nr:mannose-6-phosphate receptor binding domain-containing protein [Tuber indicum]
MRFWIASPISTLPFFVFSLLQLTIATTSNTLQQEPCTVISTQSGNFFDLRPLIRTSASTSSSSSSSNTVHDWTARGHDYPANFTLNICAPVLSDVADAVSISTSQKSNISAFYITQEGKQYSIGSVSTNPYFRGRKLVLVYAGGSPCPAPDEEREEDEEKEREKGKSSKKKKKGSGYRKSTIMSHLCDRDAIRPVISFVGEVNECGYFFEVRSSAACPTAGTQALGPVSVFGIIGLVAALVYLVGGCVYQRTVMHARGWRQIPNYAVWAGLVGGVWVGFLFKLFSRYPSSSSAPSQLPKSPHLSTRQWT